MSHDLDRVHSALKYLDVQIARVGQAEFACQSDFLNTLVNVKELIRGTKVLEEQSHINENGEQVTRFLVTDSGVRG